MATHEIQQTQVDMDGLLEVLGKNLYSSDLVVIRELIQNAHDACIRRRLEDKTAPPAKLTVRADPDRGILLFQDNGSGLMQDEIVDYLATIGKGFTRVLKNIADDGDLIGQFGLGFLTAYVVSSKVEVFTTSYQTPEVTWKFTSYGGKTFSIAQTENESVGTRVCLYLKENYLSLSDPDQLRRYLSKCCKLLSMVIILNDQLCQDKTLIPWKVTSEVPLFRLNKINLEFARLFEPKLEPLFAFPIAGHNGILWIQDGAFYGASDFRNVSVFIRNMFITDDCRDLLPEWASFIGCVIDSQVLTPTASREDIIKDSSFHQLKQDIEYALIEGLKAISVEYPDLWSSVLKRHNQALLGAAVANDALFDLMHDQLCLPTSIGDLRVSRLLRDSDEFYIKSEDKNNYQDVLFRAQKIPVVHGYLYAAYSFIRKYCDWYSKRLVDVASLNNQTILFTPIGNPTPEQTHVIEKFTTHKEEASMCSFQPASIPIVVCENKDRRLKQRIEEEAAAKRIGSAALALARIHTERMDAEKSHFVYVNWSNPLIKSLVSMSEEKKNLVVSLLTSYMKTLCHDIEDDEIEFLNEMECFMSSLEGLI